MNKRKRNAILLSAVILRIFVRATFIALASRLGLFLQDAEGAISLLGDTEVALRTEEYSHNDTDIQQNLVISDTGSVVGVVYNLTDEIQPLDTVCLAQYMAPSAQGTVSQADWGADSHKHTLLTGANLPQLTPMYNPGFETSDDKQVWTTSTQIDIFKITYENGVGEVTVQSDNGEKVFAPGTDNSYTFKLKNTGDVNLAYTMDVKAYFTPASIDLPIDGRMNRYDGKWLTSGAGAFIDVLALDGIHDEDVLAAGKYTYYTLDWRWLFESGHDDIDTMLGNMAVDQDLTLTIEINTTATATEEPGGGITVPDTGDNTNTILWLCLLFGSTLLLALLIYYRKSMKEEER